MRLGVIVSYKVAQQRDGGVLASDKFLAEMSAYGDRWPGPVDVYVATTPATDEVLGSSPLPEPTGNLSYFAVEPHKFGFDSINPLPDVLLSAIDAPLHLVAKRAKGLPVATVVAVEYTFKTRFQQVAAEHDNLRGRLGGLKWNVGQEARIIGALRNADGLQANGYPAFNYYKRFSKSAMVYLDNRAVEADMPSIDDVGERIRGRGQAQALRLAFSGRLEARKGPMEIIGVAAELERQGVDFTFMVAGDGPLRAELEAGVAKAGLADRFDITGVLDFDRELMPRLRQDTDVFFCPHPQGDPSCTYVETLACGVPIVGYANEAVAALAGATEGVQRVDIGDGAAAATALAALGADVDELERRSRAALAFARAHSFERTYDARVEHLLSFAR